MKKTFEPTSHGTFQQTAIIFGASYEDEAVLYFFVTRSTESVICGGVCSQRFENKSYLLHAEKLFGIDGYLSWFVIIKQ